METIETKKRYGRMVTAFVVCVSLLIGSAFALNTSYQSVSMPDPYGVSMLSMSEDTTSRTISVSGSVKYGYTSSLYTSFSGSTSLSYGAAGTYSIGSYSNSAYYGKSYIYVGSGTTLDIVAPVSYPVSEYKSIVVSGGGTFYLYTSSPFAIAYPDTVQVLVNGSVVGSAYSVSSSGSYTLSDSEISLSSDVSTVGLRFKWSSSDTSNNSSSATSAGRQLLIYFSDQCYVTPVIDDSLDYEPFFNRVIAWEQSIYGAISNLGDTLSSSIGGSIDKIASVFATDDDVQLRSDMDDTLDEVTTQFYDQTSTSSTAMTVETVQNVKGISDGMDAMFSSGYSVSDAFTEIADNDDFMSWFTSDCASSLDSTGAVAVVDDDDPYNMYFYYNQVNAIAERRGGE